MTIQVSTLSNGMQIVTENMPGSGSAVVGVWAMVGSRHETENQNGVSHFLEHMAFKGTTQRTARRIAEDIESKGGSINAYTSRDRTAYYARVLKNDVATAIDVIADILRDSTFTEDEIEVERGVILQEISETDDTPDDIIFDWAQELTYPNQALGRSILGTRERVKAFQRSDFQSYIKNNYTPDRMILSAAGGVDHNAIVKQAETLFSDMKSIKSTQFEEPARFDKGQLIKTKDLEQAHYLFSMPGPSRTDPDRYAAISVCNILGGGMSSRLFQTAREELGLCYTIYSTIFSSSDSGQFIVYSGTGPEQIRTLAELVPKEMTKLVDTLSEQELTSTKNQLKASLIMSQESSHERCERLAAEMAFFGRVRPVESVTAAIDAISVEKAREMAEKLFYNPSKIMVTYAPESDIPSLDELTIQRAS